MKRTGAKDKNKRDLKLKRRLELVRTTIRELTPAQLDHVNGGTDGGYVETGCAYRPFTG